MTFDNNYFDNNHIEPKNIIKGGGEKYGENNRDYYFKYMKYKSKYLKLKII